ncbi:hypothetical protein ACQPZP_33945 [Spirillospora sp. CA-142024]|uniref:hypothetical protein n=1 Tax=Spirillospora sp. CA-142024 TaxID=3240036 RepID=UPI003D8F9C80
MTMGGDELRPTVIRFTANVKADELRFDEAPESSVVFTGDAADESTSGSTRTNLPDEVEENVTYRDVQVHYKIEAKLRRPSDTA